MKALIVVDMQNDFMPGGALGVPNADRLVFLINLLIEKFPLVVATKDWHPKDHMSFAANHSDKQVGDKIFVDGIEQILWPVHCVQDTFGSEFVSTLNHEKFENVFLKGVETTIDSYSTFFDNAKKRSTGLDQFLKEKNVDEIYIVGVATDYCVLYSVLDALELGYKVFVIQDGCAPINLQPEDEKKAFEIMQKKGAVLLSSQEVL